MKKTLQDLDAGDLAYIESFPHADGIVRIDRITKTQIITTGGSKYRICDGNLIIEIPTDISKLEELIIAIKPFVPEETK